ncbi:MAG: DUF2127 domain-containing protein [Deltaproteobacteria bacterium]|nr:DUF2127 domain-containing protein [Deltaproteobacteria bacterium]
MKKEKHSAFLKFIIGYKGFIGIVQLFVSISVFNFLDSNVEATFTNLCTTFRLNTENEIIAAAIKKAGMIENGTFIGITLVIFVLGAVNLVEAWGLHLRRRWAEWLTVFATGALIPLEIYEVYSSITPLKVGILILNVAIVLYLAKHKELFKSRKKRAAASHLKVVHSDSSAPAPKKKLKKT